jgi:tripartite-type tricarboxylate transporter receptor subunit TctC
LREAVKKAAQTEEFKTALQRAGSEPAYIDAPEFLAWWDKQTELIATAVRGAGKIEGQ